MATSGEDTGSDEVYQFTCSSCVKKNIIMPAVSYCVECQGYCCQSCVDTHYLFPALENHKLLDRSSFNVSNLSTYLPELPTERCVKHTFKVLDMYCGNHDEVGCTTCIALEHRSCTDIRSIPDNIDTLFKRSDVESTYKNLQEKKAVVKRLKETKQICTRGLLSSKDKAVKAIIEIREDLERILKDLERQSIQEVENECKKIESTLKEDSKKAGESEEAIQRALSDLKSSEGNRAQQFVSMKNAQKKINAFENMSRSLDRPLPTEIKLTANTNIKDYLKGLKMFGEIRTHVEDSFSPKSNLYSVQRSTDMDVKFTDDMTSCSGRGCCLTEDGLVLLADYSNHALKRIDPVKLMKVDRIRFSSRPCSVCCTSTDEAAVSLNGRTIKFVSLGNCMSLKHELNLDHNCFGIAYNDNKLYISDNGSSIYIYSTRGYLLQKVANIDLLSGKNMSYSVRSNRMFLCEWHNGLVTFDAQGEHLNTFKDQTLVLAHGVCTDKQGNVFVCGFGSQNVLQVAEDGKTKLGAVVKNSDGLVRPLSLCFNPQNSLLIVSQCNNDKIKIFHLQQL